MKEKMKYYDKEIERRNASLVEVVTLIIVFLISFWAGYIVGIREAENNVQNVQELSMYQTRM